MDTLLPPGMVTGMQQPMRQSRSMPRLSAGLRPHGLATGELVKLHHALADALPTQTGVVTQLVAPEPDASITHVAYDLAYISASWLNKRVLFVDGTGMRDDANGSMLPTHRDAFFATSFDPSDLEASISRVVGLELYQMNFPSMRGALDLAPMLRRIPEFMDRLRQTFDLVVIASPSAEEAPMAIRRRQRAGAGIRPHAWPGGGEIARFIARVRRQCGWRGADAMPHSCAALAATLAVSELSKCMC
jgi:hypothetical protein